MGSCFTFMAGKTRTSAWCPILHSILMLISLGRKSKKGRDFTWLHSIGILFGHHQFYLGGRTVSKWQESTRNMLIHLNGEFIVLPNGEGKTRKSPETGLTVQSLADTNKVKVKVEGLFDIEAGVVPITSEESRVHGYDVTEEDCFAHLELNFKFESISKTVDGVLGQTYRQNYQSRVKMAAPMPVMGGAEKFASSHLFATDCSASKFGLRKEEDGDGVALRVECGSSVGGKGILCKRIADQGNGFASGLMFVDMLLIEAYKLCGAVTITIDSVVLSTSITIMACHHQSL
ncbi:hypothetical protein RHSIM_Rhsim06G0010500 [Rhododendron simsii]|uniref:Uncharacterized protein n=1 Tax=Rhododendron simsii TaxID=118357 RepID=A0A834GWF7_RHOSS|nr:hypothetical protein RHSIM_Rhsim06G0010500 [Rhododendron simsii]